jgi:hypothetical protein
LFERLVREHCARFFRASRVARFSLAKHTKSGENIPKYSKIYQITAKYTKLQQNIPNYSKIYKIAAKYTKLRQNIPNGHKIGRPNVNKIDQM